LPLVEGLLQLEEVLVWEEGLVLLRPGLHLWLGVYKHTIS
jgi:hypothetical protein